LPLHTVRFPYLVSLLLLSALFLASMLGHPATPSAEALAQESHQVDRCVAACQLSPAEREWMEVHWCKDGQEAFQVARQTGRPIFAFHTRGSLGHG
jgi:hypothetical protein